MYTYQIAEEYREDLRQLRRQQHDNKREIAWIEQVDKSELKYYQQDRLDELKADNKIISGMISSTEYALFWIESGHEQAAYEKRPITNANKKIRTQLWGEIEHAPFIDQEESERELSEEEQVLIDEVLESLPDIERDVYVSIYGKGNTHEQTAQFVGIPRSSITYRLNRAQKLIDHQLLYGKQTALL